MVMQKEINQIDSFDSHQFAFYGLNHIILQQKKDDFLIVDDQELVHRVVRVVKLKISEKFIVFDQKRHALVTLVSCDKVRIKIQIVWNHENKILEPAVTCLLPLLKKEALEEAVYSLAEIGINNIQLVSTEKSRKNLTDKEMQRLHKIVIAAAEQSKYYAFPSIYAVKNLSQVFTEMSLESFKIVFDVSGKSFFDVYQQAKNKQIHMIVGPEGGLTEQELFLIKEQGFYACSLTPTVLRALQAVAVGAGLLRVL